MTQNSPGIRDLKSFSYSLDSFSTDDAFPATEVGQVWMHAQQLRQVLIQVVTAALIPTAQNNSFQALVELDKRVRLLCEHRHLTTSDFIRFRGSFGIQLA